MDETAKKSREFRWKRRREYLAANPIARLEAIALFPLQTAQMASTLNALLECRKLVPSGWEKDTPIGAGPNSATPRELDRHIADVAAKICERYREIFGKELGQ